MTAGNPHTPGAAGAAPALKVCSHREGQEERRLRPVHRPPVRPLSGTPTGRPFTPSRLALCADAEAAIAGAQAEVGHLVPAREARRFWIMIQSDRMAAPAAARWAWMLEPAVLDGRVVKVVEKTLAYFGIAGLEESGFLPPADRQYGARLLDLCGRGEKALLQAMRDRGAMALPSEISSAWAALFKERFAPACTGEGWSRALEPAVQGGRVIKMRRGDKLYFGLEGDPGCVLPPPPLPRWTTEKLERCERAERALESAVALAGAMVMVTTLDICEAWERLFGEPPPPRVRNQMYKALEPAVMLGRVRAASRITRGYLFAPIARMDLLPPAYVSDLERVEEAVRRAVTRMASAVLMEEVETEIARDPELALQTQLDLGSQLQNLVACARVSEVRSRRRQGRCRKYYSTLWGPRWVLAAAEHHLDRRLRAARALWKASRGHAFTTTALRRYANDRASYRTEGDPPYAWTSALQCLLDDGELVRISAEDMYHVRWAPASEWNALTTAERERALRDAARCPTHGPGTGIEDADVDRSPLDVGFASHAQDMRALVLLAKARALATESDSSRRLILRARPVMLADVKRAAETRPELVPRTGTPLGVYLQDAARDKNGIRRKAITCLGLVRNRAFYDIRATATGKAYVAYRLALREATPVPLRRILSKLRDAIELHTSGTIPLTDQILDRRAEALLQKIRWCRTHLEKACVDAALLVEEQDEAEKKKIALRHMEEALTRLRPLSPGAPAGVEPDDALEVLEAWQSLEGLYSMPDSVERRMLAARFTVPVIRGPLTKQPGRPGRSVELRMERIEFARYASARFGFARSGHFVAQGFHALGNLRTPDPFIAALRDGSRTSAHAPAAAALGLLDDPVSRSTLAEYIVSALGQGEEQCAPGTTIPACEAAVYGLAPSPFGGLALELGEQERQALRLAADTPVENQLRALGRRVLRAWDEEWNRDQLLRL